MNRAILVFFLLLSVFQCGCTSNNGSDGSNLLNVDGGESDGDTTAPTGGTIEINGGIAVTSNLTVELSLNASGVSRMVLSNADDFTGMTWETYSATKTWTMASGGDGTRTVYVKFSDDVGNETEVYSDSIDYDSTAPTGGTIEINGGITVTSNLTVELSLHASDASRMMLSNSDNFTGMTWERYSATKTWTMAPGGDGTRTVYVKFSDDVGNETEVYSDSIDYDSTAPTGGTIEINGGVTVTSNLTVELLLNASDASRMMLSNSDNFTEMTWERYSATKTWTMASGGDGTRTVYVKFSDDAGNETEVYSDSIDYDSGMGIPSYVLLVDQGNSSGVYNGETWKTAYNNLQDALNDTDLLGNGGTEHYAEIWVSKGRYTPDVGAGYSAGDRSASFVLKEGVKIYGGFSGVETEASSRDFISNPTMLSGDIGIISNKTDDSYHVVYGYSTTNSSVLDGFAIADGYANGTLDQQMNGGGILLVSADPIIKNCLIQTNFCNGKGGGLLCSSSSPVFQDCSFEDNDAAAGGGIYADGTSAPTFTNCGFERNYAGSEGGGIYFAGANLYLENCTVENNYSTTNGGGIYLGGGELTLSNIIIDYNRSGDNGGGIYMTPNQAQVRLHFDSGHINNNEAIKDGGGIYRNGGDIYTGHGVWNGPPDEMWGEYNIYFSVDTNGTCHENSLLYPAKVYNNTAHENGSQLII